MTRFNTQLLPCTREIAAPTEGDWRILWCDSRLKCSSDTDGGDGEVFAIGCVVVAASRQANLLEGLERFNDVQIRVESISTSALQARLREHPANELHTMAWLADRAASSRWATTLASLPTTTSQLHIAVSNNALALAGWRSGPSVLVRASEPANVFQALAAGLMGRAAPVALVGVDITDLAHAMGDGHYPCEVLMLEEFKVALVNRHGAHPSGVSFCTIKQVSDFKPWIERVRHQAPDIEEWVHCACVDFTGSDCKFQPLERPAEEEGLRSAVVRSAR